SCMHPSRSLPRVESPRSSCIFSSHTSGMSSTRSLPSMSALSISKRKSTWHGYVASSASTRMKSFFTRVANRYRFSGVNACGPRDAEQVFGRERLRFARHGLRDRLLGQRGEELDELAAAANLHLLQQTLALVQAHPPRAAHRLIEEGLGKILLVFGVPGLVHH